MYISVVCLCAVFSFLLIMDGIDKTISRYLQKSKRILGCQLRNEDEEFADFRRLTKSHETLYEQLYKGNYTPALAEGQLKLLRRVIKNHQRIKEVVKRGEEEEEESKPSPTSTQVSCAVSSLAYNPYNQFLSMGSYNSGYPVATITLNNPFSNYPTVVLPGFGNVTCCITQAAIPVKMDKEKEDHDIPPLVSAPSSPPALKRVGVPAPPKDPVKDPPGIDLSKCTISGAPGYRSTNSEGKTPLAWRYPSGDQ